MYFLHRGDDYIDVSGLSFRDFMAGKLPGFEGQYPTMEDFEDHMTTAFPEVRLKGYLEMHGQMAAAGAIFVRCLRFGSGCYMMMRHWMQPKSYRGFYRQ